MQGRTPTVAKGQHPVPLTPLWCSWQQHGHMHGEEPHGIMSFRIWRHLVRHPAPTPNDASAPHRGLGGLSRANASASGVCMVGQDSPGRRTVTQRGRVARSSTLNYQTAHLYPVSQCLTCHNKIQNPNFQTWKEKLCPFPTKYYYWGLFSSPRNPKSFQDSLSYRILRDMHKALNINKNKTNHTVWL